ncbi:MAG TPA: 8-amino-7-oxononanoate synthase [Desulfurivibrionaceae bacterium]|nr:8-amino-7-oxononanoate synthase [Desulfurivibrionaceae bacterium]
MDFLKRRLADYNSAGRYRRLQPMVVRLDGRVVLAGSDDRPLLDFSSNDYLALSQHPELIKASCAALERYGAGVGAARLMSGDLALFHQLEREVADFKGCAAALLFGSGYMANVGLIPALVGRGDVVFTDRLNHASIYDGCRLAGARLLRFRHNDPEHLESLLKKERGSGRGLVVIESLYSMDGDIAPLADLVELKNRHACLLMVDEAHATGVFGIQGGGLIQEAGLEGEVDVVMGTFGKALGSYGAYVAGSQTLREYLINRARSFIYSTGLPPAVVGASLAAVRLVRDSPELRAGLMDKVAYFKACLSKEGLPGTPGPSQVVPVMVGDGQVALALAEECCRLGLFATAIRPPTVPEGTARVRFSVTLHHQKPELAEAARLLMDACRRLSISASF